MAILIRNARVLTFDDARRELARADVLVQGRTIVAVGPDLEPPANEDIQVIDGAGKLVMPGLVNAHLHADSQLMQALRKEKVPVV